MTKKWEKCVVRVLSFFFQITAVGQYFLKSLEIGRQERSSDSEETGL